MTMMQPLFPIHEVINQIIAKNEGIASFWSDAQWWAPIDAARLLSRSRLDRQVSLSRTLALWVSPEASVQALDMEGRLILGWANLGSLVEGSMKWFLSVHYKDYKADIKAHFDKKHMENSDCLTLERLRVFFNRVVWALLDDDIWDTWVLHVQQRRNAIHSYKDRNIGTLQEIEENIRIYWDFIGDLDARVPYPDYVYHP